MQKKKLVKATIEVPDLNSSVCKIAQFNNKWVIRRYDFSFFSVVWLALVNVLSTT